MTTRTDVPADVRAAWQAACDAWDDPARHDALFEHVARTGSYAWAAARYKEHGEEPIAAARLAKLRRAAEAAMLATAFARPPERRRSFGVIVMVAALAFAVAVALVVAVAIARRNGANEGNGRIVPAGSAAR
jgi:hypothetical protein